MRREEDLIGTAAIGFAAPNIARHTHFMYQKEDLEQLFTNKQLF